MNARYAGDRTTGFASPASDSVEGPIDLSQTLDLANSSRYPVRVRGATFAARGILDGDILIADTAGSPQAGQLVIPWPAGRVLLVELQKWGNTWWLVSGDNTHPPLRLILHGIWKSGPLLPAWCVREPDVLLS
jgi:DNA polymerase V